MKQKGGCMMKVRVYLENDDFFDTTINGTKEDVIAYYKDKTFNVGTIEDNMQKVTEVEFLGE